MPHATRTVTLVTGDLEVDVPEKLLSTYSRLRIDDQSRLLLPMFEPHNDTLVALASVLKFVKPPVGVDIDEDQTVHMKLLASVSDPEDLLYSMACISVMMADYEVSCYLLYLCCSDYSAATNSIRYVITMLCSYARYWIDNGTVEIHDVIEGKNGQFFMKTFRNTHEYHSCIDRFFEIIKTSKITPDPDTLVGMDYQKWLKLIS